MGPSITQHNQPIDENNIQECISGLISKHMPCETPPWQIKLIQLSDESAYYILIRIHHLILDEQKNLNIGDMMLLDRSKGMSIINTVPNEEKYLIQTPLDNIIKTPINLFSIYEDIIDGLISRWNEFVMKHDSLDHFDGIVKRPESLYDLFSSLTMTFLNTYIDYKQRSNKVLKGSTDPQLHFRYMNDLFSIECQKRQLSFRIFFRLLGQALHPLNVIKNTLKFILRTICIWMFLSPFYILRELNALRRFLFLNEDINSNSFCGFFLTYIPLCFGAVKELLVLSEIVFTAPRMFVEELLKSREDEGHYLNSTLSGRKHVSWSDTILIDRLHAKALRNKQCYSEVMFSTISLCLLKFFQELEKEQSLPSHINFNFRSVPFSYLYGVNYTRKGVIGLKLPLEESSLRQFASIREEIIQSRRNQIVFYLLSLIQIRFDFLTTVIPSMWLKLLINFISKKFPISITLVLGMNEYEPKEMITCYNAEIVDVFFFRTPQSNITLNITIQRFKEKVHLNVMCDSNVQNYQLISNNFKNAFYKIPLVKKSW